MAFWKKPNPSFWKSGRSQVVQQRITEHDLMPGLRVLEGIKRLDRAGRARAIAFLQRNGMPRGSSFDAFSNNALKLYTNLQRSKKGKPDAFAVADNAQNALLNNLKTLARLERKLKQNKLL